MPYVQACTAFDAATQTCTAQAWVVLPTFLPPLSVNDALSLVAVIGVLWASAYGLRMVSRMVWRG